MYNYNKANVYHPHLLIKLQLTDKFAAENTECKHKSRDIKNTFKEQTKLPTYHKESWQLVRVISKGKLKQIYPHYLYIYTKVVSYVASKLPLLV